MAGVGVACTRAGNAAPAPRHCPSTASDP